MVPPTGNSVGKANDLGAGVRTPASPVENTVCIGTTLLATDKYEK